VIVVPRASLSPTPRSVGDVAASTRTTASTLRSVLVLFSPEICRSPEMS
jgi:hypothetical protein